MQHFRNTCTHIGISHLPHTKHVCLCLGQEDVESNNLLLNLKGLMLMFRSICSVAQLSYWVRSFISPPAPAVSRAVPAYVSPHGWRWPIRRGARDCFCRCS